MMSSGRLGILFPLPSIPRGPLVSEKDMFLPLMALGDELSMLRTDCELILCSAESTGA